MQNYNFASMKSKHYSLLASTQCVATLTQILTLLYNEQQDGGNDVRWNQEVHCQPEKSYFQSVICMIKTGC